ncbi:Unspecific monooxygenase [Candidatus Protofrankia datiscae]|uniref:Unspecific monooxygenase n=3 Tax=Candidatus Protofrankia datiscae TaxID=2716812 RepID=F8B317_9ACTN|nr:MULTISPECIES: cytochrome P450 [Protofrankia]AEH09925.1 Unspecific monooxygenase [Candidatus Protofrankia datiscae]
MTSSQARAVDDPAESTDEAENAGDAGHTGKAHSTNADSANRAESAGGAGSASGAQPADAPGGAVGGAAIRPGPHPPGPSGQSLRTAYSFLTNPLDLLIRLRHEHGPIVRGSLGRGTVYLVNDPAAVQEILVSSQRVFAKGFRRKRMPLDEGIQPLALLLGSGLLTSSGELHRARRRLIQPLFHRQRIATYGGTFARLAEETISGWSDGQRLNIHEEMTELTLGIVTRTVFDLPMNSDLVLTIRRAIAANMGVSRRAILPGSRYLEKIPLPTTLRARNSRADLDRLIREIIADRRREGADGNDLLSLLLTTRDAETGAPLDDDAVRDEALTILLAGHETTANALSWAFHLLGNAPQAREALHAELDEVLGDRLPTLDDLPRLPYTRAVFTESIRLYPPVWIMFRRTVADHSLGGYDIPAGSTVLVSQWVMHRDPDYWPDPDGFVPQRWLEPSPTSSPTDETQPSATGPASEPRSTATRPKYAFFPFGGGSRQCIGNTFAELEAAIVLATVCRRWHLEPTPGHSVTPLPRVTLRPRSGVPVIAHRRNP